MEIAVQPPVDLSFPGSCRSMDVMIRARSPQSNDGIMSCNGKEPLRYAGKDGRYSLAELKGPGHPALRSVADCSVSDHASTR